VRDCDVGVDAVQRRPAGVGNAIEARLGRRPTSCAHLSATTDAGRDREADPWLDSSKFVDVANKVKSSTATGPLYGPIMGRQVEDQVQLHEPS